MLSSVLLISNSATEHVVAKEPLETKQKSLDTSQAHKAIPGDEESKIIRPETTGTQPYVDRLIDPAMAEDPELADLVEQQQKEAAYYFFDMETKAYTFHGTGSSTNNYAYGTSISTGKETINYGNLRVRGTLIDTNDSPYSSTVLDNKLAGSFSLYQTDFPLSETMNMDNTLGVYRFPSGWDIGKAYRYRLPFPLLLGASSQLNYLQNSYRLAIGNLGEQHGFLLPAFEETSGFAVSAGYTRSLINGWLVSADLWNVSGRDRSDEDRSGLSAVVNHLSLDGNSEQKLHMIGDSQGHYGVMVDGNYDHLRFSNSYGAHYFGPDLYWINQTFSDNNYGTYLSSRYDAGRARYNGGFEILRYNADRDDQQGAKNRLLGNLGFNYRLGRKIGTGATGYYRYTQPDDNAIAESTLSQSTLYLNQQHSRAYNSRINLQYRSTDDGDQNSSTSEIEYVLGWRPTRTGYYTLELGYQYQTNETGNDSSPAAGVTAQYDLAYGGSLGGALRYSRYDYSTSPDSDNWYGNFFIDIPFLENWSTNLQLSYNNYNYDLANYPDRDDEFATRDDLTATFTLRYQFSGGMPVRPLGQKPGQRGAGTLEGVVFVDENHDSIRQPDERGMANVEVYLDNRYPARTDRQGRFTFPIVGIGRHMVDLLEDTLPLPWEAGLHRPRPVQVGVRDTTVVELPLVRIRDE